MFACVGVVYAVCVYKTSRDSTINYTKPWEVLNAIFICCYFVLGAWKLLCARIVFGSTSQETQSSVTPTWYVIFS